MFGDGPLHPAAGLPEVMGRIEQALQLGSGQLGADLGIGTEHRAQVHALLHRLAAALLDQMVGGVAADLFQRDYLDVAQPGGGDPLHYPYRYLAPVNTGVPSGLDLDGDGNVGGEHRARGNDAWGYGLHPGQYGMLVLSRHPIDATQVRTFQHFRWSALPDARQPRDPATGDTWYPPSVWAQLRLSSKSHWDVPVRTPAGVIHLLAAHPTPPVFDGPENRNGLRRAPGCRPNTSARNRWQSAP